MIENYKHKYISRGKHVFVPNERCVRKGRRILRHFRGIQFPAHFYHYQSGGHVGALHAHLANSFFFNAMADAVSDKMNKAIADDLKDISVYLSVGTNNFKRYLLALSIGRISDHAVKFIE